MFSTSWFLSGVQAAGSASRATGGRSAPERRDDQAEQRAVTAAFDARVGSMDFSDPSAVTTINDWVAENTKGMIDGIVDALDPSLVMLLTNAVFFDGSWTTSFDPEETRRAAFQREDGSTVEVDMMSLRNVEMPRGGDASYSAVELPYGDGGFAMVIALTRETSWFAWTGRLRRPMPPSSPRAWTNCSRARPASRPSATMPMRSCFLKH